MHTPSRVVEDNSQNALRTENSVTRNRATSANFLNHWKTLVECRRKGICNWTNETKRTAKWRELGLDTEAFFKYKMTSYSQNNSHVKRVPGFISSFFPPVALASVAPTQILGGPLKSTHNATQQFHAACSRYPPPSCSDVLL